MTKQETAGVKQLLDHPAASRAEALAEARKILDQLEQNNAPFCLVCEHMRDGERGAVVAFRGNVKSILRMLDAAVRGITTIGEVEV